MAIHLTDVFTLTPVQIAKARGWFFNKDPRFGEYLSMGFTQKRYPQYIEEMYKPKPPQHFPTRAMRDWLNAYVQCVGTTVPYDHIRSLTKARQNVKNGRYDIMSKSAAAYYLRHYMDVGAVTPIPGYWVKRPMHSVASTNIASRFVLPLGEFTVTILPSDVERYFRNHVGRHLIALAREWERVGPPGARWTVTHGQMASQQHGVDFLVTDEDERSVAVIVSVGREPNPRDVRNAKWVARRAANSDAGKGSNRQTRPLNLVATIVVHMGERGMWHSEGFFSCGLDLLEL